MMIFKFRALSDEVEDFVRDYEVPYDMPLIDFHHYILKSLDYNPCEMASFFISDSEWEKLQEFTLLDMGSDGVDIDEDDDIAPPVPMANLLLSQVIHNKFDRLIYVFDMFAERQLYIELLNASVVDPEATYPRIVSEIGAAPAQFLDDEPDAPKSVFDEAMDEFGEFAGDENYDDE